jgi:hypothetical protein
MTQKGQESSTAGVGGAVSVMMLLHWVEVGGDEQEEDSRRYKTKLVASRGKSASSYPGLLINQINMEDLLTFRRQRQLRISSK